MLEEQARIIKKKQDALSRKRKVLFQENYESLHSLTQEIDFVNESLRRTKKRVKSLISTLRHVAKQEHIDALEEKKELLHIDRWLTKKELKKIIFSSFEKEQ